MYYHVYLACYKTSNYLETITLSDLTHMVSMADPVAIDVETPRMIVGTLWRKSLLN